MRKHILIAFSASLFCSKLHAQSNVPTTATGPSSATARPLPTYIHEPSIYYTRTLTPVIPITDSSLVKITASIDSVAATTLYYSKLGRPLQTVIKQASPLKYDYVIPYLFDEFNRQNIQYLPYAHKSIFGGTPGVFKDTALKYDSIFYTGEFPNEQIFYSQKIFDASPLQRLTKVTAQGNSWTGADRGISFSQRANAISDSVRLWTIAITGEDDVPTTAGTYQAGSLLVQEVTDERGIKTISYSDELGRTVLAKRQIASSPSTGHTGWLCTYYIYDEMNNLRMVVPPKAVDSLNKSSINWDLTYGSGAINTGLCYAYYYDDRGRVIMKRIPGRGKSYIAYDLLDRVVMTQDSNLRQTNQWTFIKYDGQSRPYRSGVITTTLSKDSVWAQAARSSDYPTLSGTYTIMTEDYFDDYSWTSGTPLNSTLVTSNINSVNFITSYNSSPLYAQQITASSRIRGAATGSKKLIFGTSTYLYTLAIYDEFGRAIQVKQTNYSGGTDVLTVQYSFAGLNLRTHLYHQKSGTNAQTHTLLTKYSYDPMGRVLSIIKNIDSTSDKTVSRIAYNQLGQMKVDTLGDNITSQNYQYNIRGWLCSINKGFVDTAGSTSAYFGETLSYDWGFTNNQYNGAIAGSKWKKAGDGVERAYGYTYDNANRLTTAEYSQHDPGQWANNIMDFTTSGLTYDANGNILTMKQRGWNIGGPVTFDSLTYQYFANTNQLQKITEGAGRFSGMGDFTDTVATSDTVHIGDYYAYDANGNIVKDLPRHNHTTSGGNGSVYNLFNMPDSISFLNKAIVHYYYDASGAMLSKKVDDYSSGSLVTNTYIYINGFVYKNDTAQYVLYEEGRIRYNVDSSKFFYDYFLKDHLGNIRTVLTEEQKTDAYPPASLETAQLSTERLYYSKVDSGRVNKSAVSGYPTDTYTSPNDYIQQLNGNGVKVGTGMVLRVMAGDKFNLRVSSWWASKSSPGTTVSATYEILDVLNNSVAAASGGKYTSSGLSGGNAFNTGLYNFLSTQSYNTSRPKAFVNWIFFDEQFNFVSSCSGFDQVGTMGTFTVHTQSDLPITKDGYLYVYVSNETTNIDVIFDNLQVTHIRGPLLQEASYHPFGLEMQSISCNALNFGSPDNSNKFNGGDEWEESLNLYSTFFRGYDQQIGRFRGVDLLSELDVSGSGYQFAKNDPIFLNDPAGLTAKPGGLIGKIIRFFERLFGGSGEGYYGNTYYSGDPTSISYDDGNGGGEESGGGGGGGVSMAYVIGALGGWGNNGVTSNNSGGGGSGNSGVSPDPPGPGNNEGQIWYYVYETGGMGHSLAYNPYNNTLYEIQHPEYGTKRGFKNWLNGGAKSQGYSYNMYNKYDFNRFWGFMNNRGALKLAAVYIPHPEIALKFFTDQVGKDYDYNVANDNCKDFVLDGFAYAGASVHRNSPFPRFSISGQYIYSWAVGSSVPIPINPSTPPMQIGSGGNNAGPPNWGMYYH